MRQSVTAKARRRASVSPNRRHSHTWNGVKLLSPRAGEWKTPDGRWRLEEYEGDYGGWQLFGPGHDGTSVKGPESATEIIRRYQESEVTA